MNTLTEGCEIKKHFLVKDEDTALKVGSGGLRVLATPVIATWVEGAAYELLQLSLSDKYTSVGTKIDLNHISPTPVNMKVTVNLTVEKINKRHYCFSFKVNDPVCEIANGIHERVIVDIESFMAKVSEKDNESK